MTITFRRSDALLLIAFLSSGLSAVGLELIWIRVLGLAFGSETFGMLGVLAGFFAGLALGAALLHHLILRSGRPVRIYVVLECLIACYAFTGPIFLLRLAQSAPRWMGVLVEDNRSLPALSLNLLIAMMVLLPATISMGATTVAIIEAWRRRRTLAENDDTVAWLYGVNTFGASIGIALAIYWLLPAFGIQTASAALGGFSLLAAALAWRWEHVGVAGGALPEGDEVAGERPTMAGHSRPLLYALLFFTGLAGIGLETVGTHVLTQIFDNTVHTFANILAVYLLGTALGAWWYGSLLARRLAGQREWGTIWLLYGLALAGLLSAWSLGQAMAMLLWLAPAGTSYAGRALAESLISAVVFLAPTVLMGATFSHLLGHFTYEGVGYASACNTVGASLAPFVFGLVLIPSAGYGVAFYTVVGMYLVLFVAAGLWDRRRAVGVAAGVGVAATAGVLLYSSLVLVQLPSNFRLLDRRVGLQGVVSVTEYGAEGSPEISSPRFLQVDQRYLMGGSIGTLAQRMGHLAMLMGPAQRQVLYLGLGTGILAGTALDYPIERVTGVELVPEILDMLPWFNQFNHGLQHDPRASLHASDARRFVRATADTYDVIVADLYHPNRDGTGALYTVQHYINIRSRLRDGGVFVQWLPLYQLRPNNLKIIIRTFLKVFPDADSVVGNYSGQAVFALLGWAPGRGQGMARGLDLQRAEALFHEQKGRDRVFDGVPDLLASYMLDAQLLSMYAGAGPLNTDTNQRITFDAARGVTDNYQSLATLMPYRRLFPAGFIRTNNRQGPYREDLETLRESVRPYAEAASHYLAAEIALTQPDSSLQALAEYLKAYEVDIRFMSAARKLLRLTIQQPATAKEQVKRLWLAHPEQPELNRLHQRLEGVDAPEQVGGIVAQFLQTRGD